MKLLLLLMALLHPVASRRGGDDSQATLFFGNVTQWGPTASRYVHKIRKHYKMVALVETHVEKSRIPMERETLRKDGWKLAATPA
eukprot:8075517-Pyramimonas_sp.AAC.1